MRSFFILIILVLSLFLLRDQLGLPRTLGSIDPTLLGYLALFAAGIVLAELMRPVLSLLSGPTRFTLALIIAGLGFAGITTLIPKPQPIVTPTVRVESALPLSWDGLFRTVAQINGRDIGVMVDTGSALVVLRYEEAARLGIDLAALNFNTPITIAGGRMRVSPITLQTVQVGSIAYNNIPGAVAPKGALQSTLIGLSYLRLLKQFSLRQDQLILRK